MRLFALSAVVIVSGAFGVASLAACGSSAPPSADPAPAQQTEPPAAQVNPASEPFELFGEALDPHAEVAAFKDIIAKPETFVKRTLATTGTVRAACQKRGCWMEVRDVDDRASTGLTVRFKDYGFFVPLNSRSADVKMQGVVSVEKYSAAQVKELEAEGGTVANKNPDGSATVVQFTASGVEMRGRVK